MLLWFSEPAQLLGNTWLGITLILGQAYYTRDTGKVISLVCNLLVVKAYMKATKGLRIYLFYDKLMHLS